MCFQQLLRSIEPRKGRTRHTTALRGLGVDSTAPTLLNSGRIATPLIVVRNSVGGGVVVEGDDPKHHLLRVCIGLERARVIESASSRVVASYPLHLIIPDVRFCTIPIAIFSKSFGTFHRTILYGARCSLSSPYAADVYRRLFFVNKKHEQLARGTVGLAPYTSRTYLFLPVITRARELCSHEGDLQMSPSAVAVN